MRTHVHSTCISLRALLLAGALWLALPQVGRGQLIVSVSDANGDAPLAGYNGAYASQRENDSGYPNADPPVAGAVVPFAAEVPLFTDRTHEALSARFDSATGALLATGDLIPGIPAYLLGGEYVATRNDNKDNAGFQIMVQLGQQDVTAYLLIDNRVGDDVNTNPPALGVGGSGAMSWVSDDCWFVVNTGISPNGQPDFVGIDEGSNINTVDFSARIAGANGDIQNFYTVYRKDFNAGETITLGPALHGGNMHALVVVPRNAAPPACSLRMGPANSTATATAGGADPAPATINFRACGDDPISYTAAELDANQNPANVPWMSLSKTVGGPVAPGSTDTLTINYNIANLTPGLYQAYVRIVDSCTPPVTQLHSVTLTVQPAGLLITNVVETGGDNEATDTITAKWTGQTYRITVAGEPVPGAVVGQNYTVGTFGHGAPSFVDRNHRYYDDVPNNTPVPAYLTGADYIMSGNDNRDNANYRLDVTVSLPVTVYMLIDNRLSDGANANPPTFDATHMQWMLDEAWTPTANGLNRAKSTATPDEVGIDEGADGGINQWYSVYFKNYPAGTFTLRQADNAGNNMYGVVIVANAPCQLAAPGVLNVTAFQGGASPANVNLDIRNTGADGLPTSYAIAELDQDQNGADIPWLSVDQLSGGPIAGGATETRILSFNTGSLPRGDYLAYLRITDSCTPARNKYVAVNLVIQPPDTRLPQRLAPNGLYLERSASMTWDEARVNDAAGPPVVFQGVTGIWKPITEHAQGMIVGSLGEIWLPATDADVVSTLDNANLGALLGTSEGVFKWLDGTDVPTDLWGAGEPNNDAGGQTGSNPGEDALNIRGDGRFNDNKAGSSLGQPDTRFPYFRMYEGVDLTGQGKFKVVGRRTPGGAQLADLQAAINLMNLPEGNPGIGFEARGSFYAVSFGDPGADSGGDGIRGGWTDWPKVPFPTDTVDLNDEDFANKVTGFVVIPAPGTYTFAIVHDDHAQLTVGNQTIQTPNATGTDTLVMTFDAAGDVPIEIIHRERGGDSYLQLFAAPGNEAGARFRQVFRLVGDELGGGLAVKSPIDPCGVNFADVDDDGDVDQADFGEFQACITGVVVPPSLSVQCDCFDRDGANLDGDGDVDDADFARFLDCLSGPDIPVTEEAQPNCVPQRP